MRLAPVTQPVVRTARDAAELCAGHFNGEVRAKLIVMHLDSERRLLRLRVEPAGPGGAALPIRAIIADAIRYDAVGLVLAHNRVGGDPEPDDNDIAATRKLAQAAATLGIKLHDHLVFSGADCRSLRSLGLL